MSSQKVNKLQQAMSKIQQSMQNRTKYLQRIQEIQTNYNEKYQNKIQDVCNLFEKANNIQEQIIEEGSEIMRLDKILSGKASKIQDALPELKNSQNINYQCEI